MHRVCKRVKNRGRTETDWKNKQEYAQRKLQVRTNTATLGENIVDHGEPHIIFRKFI